LENSNKAYWKLLKKNQIVSIKPKRAAYQARTTRMKLPLFAALAREYLFPAGCAVCDKALINKEDSWYGMCADCRKMLAIEHEERCSLCGKPLVSEITVCMDCRKTPSSLSPASSITADNEDARCHIDRVLSLFPYTGSYRTLLWAYKFKKCRAVGNLFVEKLLEGLPFILEDCNHPVLVPVPPRHGKIKREGWDQIEYLACLLEKIEKKEGKVPVRRCLERLPSQSQKELDRAGRQRNLLHRIRCKQDAPEEAILFDDVYTTGATMNVCAAALKQAGAKKVRGICLFYN